MAHTPVCQTEAPDVSSAKSSKNRSFLLSNLFDAEIHLRTAVIIELKGETPNA